MVKLLHFCCTKLPFFYEVREIEVTPTTECLAQILSSLRHFQEATQLIIHSDDVDSISNGFDDDVLSKLYHLRKLHIRIPNQITTNGIRRLIQAIGDNQCAIEDCEIHLQSNFTMSEWARSCLPNNEIATNLDETIISWLKHFGNKKLRVEFEHNIFRAMTFGEDTMII